MAYLRIPAEKGPLKFKYTPAEDVLVDSVAYFHFEDIEILKKELESVSEPGVHFIEVEFLCIKEGEEDKSPFLMKTNAMIGTTGKGKGGYNSQVEDAGCIIIFPCPKITDQNGKIELKLNESIPAYVIPRGLF